LASLALLPIKAAVFNLCCPYTQSFVSLLIDFSLFVPQVNIPREALYISWKGGGGIFYQAAQREKLIQNKIKS